MKSFAAIFFLIACAALPAHAVEPVVFKIEPSSSTIAFDVVQDGATLNGQFSVFSAAIAFHPEALDRSNAEVTVDMGSVTISNAEAQGMIQKKEWLDTATFRNAVFKTESFKALGGNRYEANAKLTIRNVIVPVVLAFTLEEFSSASALMKGDVTLKRKDFGIGWDDTASVSNDVKVRVAIKALAAPAP